MSPSAILTRGICQQSAAEIVNSCDLYDFSAGQLLVLDPTILYEARYANALTRANRSFAYFTREVVLYAAHFGDRPSEWKYPFARIALAKAYLTFVYRRPADEVIEHYPYLLTPGMTRYGGSVITPGGLIVAFSGSSDAIDKQISEKTAAGIETRCRHDMRRLQTDETAGDFMTELDPAVSTPMGWSDPQVEEPDLLRDFFGRTGRATPG